MSYSRHRDKGHTPPILPSTRELDDLVQNCCIWWICERLTASISTRTHSCLFIVGGAVRLSQIIEPLSASGHQSGKWVCPASLHAIVGVINTDLAALRVSALGTAYCVGLVGSSRTSWNRCSWSRGRVTSSRRRECWTRTVWPPSHHPYISTPRYRHY